MAAQFFKKFTKEEILAAFNYFDRDHSGTITTEELLEVLSKMGRNYSKEQIRKMINQVDKDNNGTISIEEFASQDFQIR